MRSKQLLLLVVASVVFTLVYAQNKPGVIAGVIKDSRSKSPLIEAVVTVSSPTMDGQKFAVTDEKGMYKIVNLPAGVYSVSFEMEGFKKFTQDSVKLSEGMSLGVSFEMARESKNVETEQPRTRFRRREIVTNDDDR